jgi:hypothetical protein
MGLKTLTPLTVGYPKLELADVIDDNVDIPSTIRRYLLLLCKELGLDKQTIVESKIDFNHSKYDNGKYRHTMSIVFPINLNKIAFKAEPTLKKLKLVQYKGVPEILYFKKSDEIVGIISDIYTLKVFWETDTKKDFKKEIEELEKDL